MRKSLNRYYILEGTEPVACDDLFIWGKAFGKFNRRVKRTVIGEICVSTVFLGLDHNFSDEGEPILFETMIFDNRKLKKAAQSHSLDQEMDRACTWDDSVKMHDCFVKSILSAVNKRGDKPSVAITVSRKPKVTV